MAKTFITSFLGLFVFIANFVSCLANDAALPTIFILRDSTADVGTNSFIPDSQARADFPQSGVDFPHGRPTGRFSNGFNIAGYLS